ncbi:TPA: hypothetical protein JBI12_14000 [Legionella pneumophila]|nr:hypothetical protein [Legionella pneumophila]
MMNYHALQKESELIENEILSLNKNYQTLKRADDKLKLQIQKAKELYNDFYPRHAFTVTASGNIFFTEEDKKAVGRYGAKTVEMENSLFVQLVNRLIANRIFVDEEFITKIAADPLKIESEVVKQLDEWAVQYTMTVSDYVDAFLWANQGQSFDNFPASGRWDVAERLYKNNPLCRSRFYNFGTEDDPMVVNPFWKEIGTDLVKEIADGKAFQGTAYTGLDLDKQKIEDLKSQAKIILQNPNDPEIKSKVTALFSEYLQLMSPMHIESNSQEEPRYRCYARSIPVLKTGFVRDPLSDWDQPIYKSTNTAVLDRKAAEFVAEGKGKQIGGGLAMMLTQELSKNTILPNQIYLQMIRAYKSGDNNTAYRIGREYLSQLDSEGYDICLMAAGTPIEEGRLYIVVNESDKDSFQYKVLAPNGQVMEGKISRADLQSFPVDKPFTEELFNSFKSQLLELTTKRGHTVTGGLHCIDMQRSLVNIKKMVSLLETLVVAPEESQQKSIQKETSSLEKREEHCDEAKDFSTSRLSSGISRQGFFKNFAYPHILNFYNVPLNKMTIPRVEQALQEIQVEEGHEVAIKTAEQFLFWARGRQLDVSKVKDITIRLRTELEEGVVEEKTFRI